MKLYDTHIHTRFSHDSNADPNEVCHSALERGLLGITITDHCDIELHGYETYADLNGSINCARKLKEEWKDKIQVFVGTEMGFSHDSFALSEKMLNELGELDQIIYSVHCIEWKGQMSAFSREDFTSFMESEIDEYIKIYFDSVLECVKVADMDILPHLTCPVKYFKKQGINLDLSKNDETIDEIIRTAISRDLAFELNASSPVEKSVIERYIELGGRKFTLGSDAHTPSSVGGGIEVWANYLKEKGINEIYYFSKRRPYSVNI